MSSNKTILSFEFESDAAAQHFKDWLSGAGEQGYWDWMECREDEEPGPITGTSFDYWSGNTISVKCGRLETA